MKIVAIFVVTIVVLVGYTIYTNPQECNHGEGMPGDPYKSCNCLGVWVSDGKPTPAIPGAISGGLCYGLTN